MSSLETVRLLVRQDLKDTDQGDPRWADAELDRHIRRALGEYSEVSPLQSKSTLQTASDSREVDVSSLSPRIRINAAEYPPGEYPPAYVPFLLWADTLTLDLASAPGGTPNVDVYWEAPHTINGTVSFPSNHDDIVAVGAAGYAALEWASYATNRLNVGQEAWGKYMDFASGRLAAFRQALRELPVANRLRTGQLYTPVTARFRSQTTDPGPV